MSYLYIVHLQATCQTIIKPPNDTLVHKEACHLLCLPGLVPRPRAVCVPVDHSLTRAVFLTVPHSPHYPSLWQFQLHSKQLLSPPLLAGSRHLSSHCSEAGVWLPPKGGPKKCTAENLRPRPTTV